MAGKIAEADPELARSLAALEGAKKPIVEAVVMAQRAERRLLLGVLGLVEDAVVDQPRLSVTAKGMRVIAACAGHFPELDTDIDGAVRKVAETIGDGR